jgi:hypothetical protein
MLAFGNAKGERKRFTRFAIAPLTSNAKNSLID